MGNTETTGQIHETFRDEMGVTFEWNIPEINLVLLKRDTPYISPDINVLERGWRLSFTRSSSDNIYVSFALWREGSITATPVHVTLFMRNSNGTLQEILRDRIFHNDHCTCRVEVLFKSGFLMPHLSTWGAVTVTCTMRTEEPPSNKIACSEEQIDRLSLEENTEQYNHGKSWFTKGRRLVSRQTQTERLPLEHSTKEDNRGHHNTKGRRLVSRQTQTERLSSEHSTKEDNRTHSNTKGKKDLWDHFKTFLHSGKNYDVTIKVKDKCFRAHKAILRDRSPVFDAMLDRMKETECGILSVDDCDPDSFDDFLQYVYTGEVENLSFGNAMALYNIRDKYKFSELKDMCVDHLKSSLSTTGVSDVITLAHDHGEDKLLKCAEEFFSEHCKEIVITEEWQRFFMRNPLQANALYIKTLQISYRKVKSRAH